MKEKLTENEKMCLVLEDIVKENKYISIRGDIHIKQEGAYVICEKYRVEKDVYEACQNLLIKENRIQKIVNDIIFLIKQKCAVYPENINPDNSFKALNKSISLINGRVIESKSELIFTFKGNVNFNDSIELAECRIFLDQIMPNRDFQEKILEFCAIAMFPSLRKDVNFDGFLICYGKGANGKSILLEHLIGQIFGKETISTVRINDLSSNKFSLALLEGKRLNITTEDNVQRIIENNQLKAITSGDKQTIERKHKDPISVNLNPIVIISVNQIPIIPEKVSYGMKRRIHMIDFPNIFVDNPQKANEFKADPDLRNPHSKKTRRIKEGLFLMITQTAENIFKNKVISPSNYENVLTTNSEMLYYRDFIKDCFEIDEGSFVASQEILEVYHEYCNHKKNSESFIRVKKVSAEQLIKKLKAINTKLVSHRECFQGSEKRGLLGLKKKSVSAGSGSKKQFFLSKQQKKYLLNLGYSNDHLYILTRSTAAKYSVDEKNSDADKIALRSDDQIKYVQRKELE